MIRKNKRITMFNKLIIMFSVLVIPVIVIGSFALINSNKTITSNVLNSVSSRIADQIQQINRDFISTNDLISYTIADSRVHRIANPLDPMSTYERATNVNYVRDLLYNIKLGNPALNNVRLYLPEIGIYYNTNFSYDYQAKSNQGSQRVLTQSICEELLSDMKFSGALHVHNDEMVFRHFSSLSKPRIFAEAIYVIPELQKLFKDTLLYNRSYYHFSLDNYNYVVTNYAGDCSFSFIDSLKGSTAVAVNIDGEEFYAFDAYLVNPNAHYVQLIPSNELLQNMEFSVIYCIVFTITVLLCSAMFIFGTYYIIHAPIKALCNALKEVENNNLTITLSNPKASDFQYLYNRFNAMTEQLRNLIQQKLQHEILLNKAQLKQLQAQINPHFLYNCFFMLNQMINRSMHKEACELSKELGIYFRYITRNLKDEVALKDEYEHTRVYASIQGKRFAGRIQFIMSECPEAYRLIPTPKLIIQPLLENSLKYGVENKIRDGLIKVTFSVLNSMCVVNVEDNGEELSEEKLVAMQADINTITLNTMGNELTGLLNIAKRLNLFYQQANCLQVSRSDLGGLKVSLLLPIASFDNPDNPDNST